MWDIKAHFHHGGHEGEPIPTLLDLFLFGNRHAYNGNISKQALKALAIFRPFDHHCSRRACGEEEKEEGQQ
jgi:hypothetical protein